MPTEEFQTVFGPTVPTPNGFFDITMQTITANQIKEPSSALAPSTVMPLNQAFTIDIQWDVDGVLWPMLGGSWDLHAYLEKMGTGLDLDLTDLANHIIPFTFANTAPIPPPPPVHYHRQFDVPAGTVTQEGAYKLIVTLTYRNLLDMPGPMAGYWEGPILQFYP